MGSRELESGWDHLPPAEAVARAWRDPGDRRKFGTWHEWARRDVAELMPLLGRALDRLLAEMKAAGLVPGEVDALLWAEAPRLDRRPCRAVACRCGHLHQRHATDRQGSGGSCRARDCSCRAYACSCGDRRPCATMAA